MSKPVKSDLLLECMEAIQTVLKEHDRRFRAVDKDLREMKGQLASMMHKEIAPPDRANDLDVLVLRLKDRVDQEA